VAAVRKLFQQVALNESAGDSANDEDFTEDLEALDGSGIEDEYKDIASNSELEQGGIMSGVEMVDYDKIPRRRERADRVILSRAVIEDEEPDDGESKIDSIKWNCPLISS
jgi:hypothetical protein